MEPEDEDYTLQYSRTVTMSDSVNGYVVTWIEEPREGGNTLDVTGAEEVIVHEERCDDKPLVKSEIKVEQEVKISSIERRATRRAKEKAAALVTSIIEEECAVRAAADEEYLVSSEDDEDDVCDNDVDCDDSDDELIDVGQPAEAPTEDLTTKMLRRRINLSAKELEALRKVERERYAKLSVEKKKAIRKRKNANRSTPEQRAKARLCQLRYYERRKEEGKLSKAPRTEEKKLKRRIYDRAVYKRMIESETAAQRETRLAAETVKRHRREMKKKSEGCSN